MLTLNLTADEKALFESNRFSARLDRRPNASRRNPCSPQDDGNPTTIGTGQTIPCPATEATAHAPYVNHAIDGTTAARRLRRRYGHKDGHDADGHAPKLLPNKSYSIAS